MKIARNGNWFYAANDPDSPGFSSPEIAELHFDYIACEREKAARNAEQTTNEEEQTNEQL